MAAYAFGGGFLALVGARLLSLLLIQMFPQFLAAVALYLMLTDMGEVVPAIGPTRSRLRAGPAAARSGRCG